MANKAAEQLIDVVQQARYISLLLPEQQFKSSEPSDPSERAIRLYIQSCQIEKLANAVSEYKSKPDFNKDVLDKCLFYAAFYGFPNAVRTLLAHGASPSHKSVTGTTTLMKAVGSRDMDTVKALLEARADVNACTNSGLSAIQIAESLGEVEMVEALHNYRGA